MNEILIVAKLHGTLDTSKGFMIHHLMNWKSSKEFRLQKAWGVEGRANMGV